MIWGAAATGCFVEAWLAFLWIAACGIAFLRATRKAATLAKMVYYRLLSGLIYSLALILQFQVFWSKLGWGRSSVETLAFLVSATAVMVIMGRRLGARIDAIWRNTNAKQ